MADTPKKAPINPDSTLTWAEMVKKEVDQSTAIAKALEPLGKVNRDAEGKEQKPIQDLGGLNDQTARAIKAEYRKLQKQYDGGYERGTALAQKAHTLRSLLEKCHKMALELAEDAKACETTVARAAAAYARDNAPKLKAQLDKADRAAKRAAKKKADLEAQLKQAS